MKLILGAALCAVQTVSAAPAFAADGGAPQMGAFAGARLRVPLGGSEKPQAGLALTSTLRNGPTGELRFAKGAEFGFSGDAPALELTLAGTPASRLAEGRSAPDGSKLGVSTLGWVAIGVGVLAVAVFTVGQLCADGEICGSE